MRTREIIRDVRPLIKGILNNVEWKAKNTKQAQLLMLALEREFINGVTAKLKTFAVA